MLNFEHSNKIKDILTAIQNNLAPEQLSYFEDLSLVEFIQAIIQVHYTEGQFDIETIHEMITLYNKQMHEEIQNVYVTLDDDHPLNILYRENEVFRNILSQIKDKMITLEQDKDASILETDLNVLGNLYAHYNRKEKLIFPILERKQVYTLPRKVWAMDDDIRATYHQLKKRLKRIDEIEFKHIKKSFDTLYVEMKQMMIHEEDILIPLIQEIFTAQDFETIANESDAFGYAVNVDSIWTNQDKEYEVNLASDEDRSQNIKFGGGYLTVKEAELILNNIPLELTFVDKNGLFKYFNEITTSADMMFIRTPISIGRSVANCHPPKSLKKMMQVMRLLKNKEQETVTMWFKKGDEYIYVTYKGVFDEAGEYQGILEYVQDIQPFMDLPNVVKRDI
ncbi:PAS domain-containing protein [Macrococcus animalis]|uniref:PAS domain-containing protein n=1 Tax=Macrococcus animalis TaxID=3395467 RepID=UPI0039BDA879